MSARFRTEHRRTGTSCFTIDRAADGSTSVSWQSCAAKIPRPWSGISAILGRTNIIGDVMTPASTDHGSILPSDASALIVSADGELSFMLADYPEDQALPRMVQLLAAVVLRSTDADWVDEMIAIFDETPRS
ncbi:hypothetical protein [Bosea minatitlanensis]|uniref:Uncharacterized protein n=2 Tax=Hyphomicrobiales TaxID=356 RepID=A0ABW0F998_9HYPH